MTSVQLDTALNTDDPSQRCVLLQLFNSTCEDVDVEVISSSSIQTLGGQFITALQEAELEKDVDVVHDDLYAEISTYFTCICALLRRAAHFQKVLTAGIFNHIATGLTLLQARWTHEKRAIEKDLLRLTWREYVTEIEWIFDALVGLTELPEVLSATEPLLLKVLEVWSAELGTAPDLSYAAGRILLMLLQTPRAVVPFLFSSNGKKLLRLISRTCLSSSAHYESQGSAQGAEEDAAAQEGAAADQHAAAAISEDSAITAMAPAAPAATAATATARLT